MVFADGRKHELNVSTYQMAILMLFNEADNLSYADISEATQIPPADLKRSLQSLACVKVWRQQRGTHSLASHSSAVWHLEPTIRSPGCCEAITRNFVHHCRV